MAEDMGPEAQVVETGHAGVDAALARLAELDGVPSDARVAVYEDVHQRLRQTLTALDERGAHTPATVHR
ncbi:hypothetical protein [Streptacidiphilus monticola]|uniref:Uncharacterized protein n=1 Tax=Streptacidiphilus monticola TaxID=2161674 RepID=A0ABW1G1G3_9ACTN